MKYLKTKIMLFDILIKLENVLNYEEQIEIFESLKDECDNRIKLVEIKKRLGV